MSQPAREPDAEGEHADDLGLTHDDWRDLRFAYNYGTLEPAEGSLEEKAFLRFAEKDRRDWDRRWKKEMHEEAYQRFRGQPFPGSPLTADLTSREAAKLSEKLYRAHHAAEEAARQADWRSARDRPFRAMQTEIWDLYRDAQAETIVSGIRQPGETSKEFTRRAWQEPEKMPDFDPISRGPQPESTDCFLIEICLHDGFPQVDEGASVLPLTLCAACPWSAGRGGGRVCRAAWGCGPGLGWSGRCGGRAAGLCPQVLPGLLAVVAGGQVEDEVPAAVACGPGRHGDQVAADGGGPCPGVAGPGARAGGAQQVVRHGGEDEPCPVCSEMTGWQVGEGARVQVGDDLLDDGVVAMLAF